MKMSRGVKIILFITICVVIFYGVRYVRTPVEVMTARMMQYEESVSAEAYFLWNERVYHAPTDGTAYHHAEEGARVGRNHVVSSVYQGEVPEEILQELANINKKMERLEARRNTMNHHVDEYTWENRLENLRREIVQMVQSGDVSAISEYKEEMEAVISGATPDSVAEEIEALKREKYLAEQKIGQTRKEIVADCSGVFSKNVDGLEDWLQVSKISEYTAADFYALPEEQTQPAKAAVLAGEPVCKVIDNHTWYAAVLVEKEKLARLRERKSVLVRFERVPGVEVEAKVVQINETEQDAHGLLILQCDKYAEGIFSLRRSGVELVLSRYQGFSVPISAIHVEGMQKGVRVKWGASEIFKACDIVYVNKEEETLIINPAKDAKYDLEPYDQIILGEKWKEKPEETPKPKTKNQSESDGEEKK